MTEKLKHQESRDGLNAEGAVELKGAVAESIVPWFVLECVC